MALLVLNRNYTLATTKGHIIHFEKGKPVHVPLAVYQEALAIGAQPPEGEDVYVSEEPARADNAPSDPAERAQRILDAIEKVVASNDRDDFTAAGSPTVWAISRVVGFKVQSKEVAAAWQQYHELKAAKANE